MERFVIQWHITHMCNLRCSHCYQQEYQSHTPTEQLYGILDKICRFLEGKTCIGQINLTGGEPLLHPEFFPLAREIRNRGFRLGILTNGTLIDGELARKLAGLEPVFVQVSLDGNEQTHDAIRGGGSFRRTLAGIDLLKKHRIRVLVSFTAQKENYREFPELAAICRKHRVDKLWWDRVVTDNERDREEKALSTGEFLRLTETAAALNRKYRRLDGSSTVENCRALQFLGCEKSTAGYRCSAGRNLLAILADGTVMPCRRLPLELGNVLEQELEEMISSAPVMGRLRQSSFPPECSGCRKLFACYGGAKCVTYGQTGEWNRRDVNCPFGS